MIDFDTVELSNFGPFKEARYSLDNKGLVQVKGVNKSDKGSDSNGAGKSSLLEAIVWCLFGKTAKGLNKTDVIRKGSSVCEVRVRFTKGDERFFLFRKRGKEEKVFIAATKDKDEDSRHATWVDMTLGTLALNQKLIEKIIGCDYEVFCESVYIGQENLPNIPAMTDRQIKDLLENASGITELDKVSE